MQGIHLERTMHSDRVDSKLKRALSEQHHRLDTNYVVTSHSTLWCVYLPHSLKLGHEFYLECMCIACVYIHFE